MADAVSTTAGPSITFSGIASGIDYKSIIDALVKAESVTVNRMEKWKDSWQKKIDELQNYNSKLSTFQSSVSELDSFEEFYSRTSLSSNEDVATVTNTPLAQPGSYNLTVGSSINHKLASQGFAATSDSVYTLGSASNAIVLTIGGNTITVTDSEASSYDADGSGDLSLEELVNAINGDSDNDDGSGNKLINAEILNDSSTSKPYRLVLTGVSGGTSNTISVPTNNTSTDFANTNIDDVEDIIGTSGSSNVTSGGTYTGVTNKSINFEVIQGGDLSAGDTVKIRWTDDELGTSGVIETSSTGTFDVEQGVQVTLDDNSSYTEGDKFKIDLWAPDLQKAQDSGLAQTEKELHSGVASEDTIINNSGSSKVFAYKYAGGDTIEVSVADGATLQDLVDAINEDSKNPGVVATIVNDGQGLSNSYHLVLTGKNQGAAYTIDIDDSKTTLDGTSSTVNFQSSTFTETQSAQNSMIRLDGFPDDSTQYIQNSSNVINNLIDGVTVTLKSTGDTTIVVANDTSAMEEKIQNFVDAYNDLMKYMDNVVKYDDKTKQAGTLQSNYAAQMVQYDIMRTTIDIPPGFKSINSLESPPGSERYVSLSSIGIKTVDDKYLEIDSSKLEDALQNHTDDVALLFGADLVGRNDTTTNKITYDSHVNNLTEPGSYDVEVTVSGGSITSAKIDGHDAVIDGNYIVGKAGYPESGLQLLVDTSVDGTYNAEIRLLRGVTKSLNEKIDDLLDSNSGPLNVLIDNYNGIINNIDKKIDREKDRILSVEKRLQNQFAKMEATVSQLNGQMQYLQANIAKLPRV